MTWLHALQVLVAVGVAVAVARRVRVLFFQAGVDAPRVLGALEAAFSEGDHETVLAMVEAGRPAWVLRVAEEALLALREGADVGRALEVALLEIDYLAEAGLQTLRAMASVAWGLGALFAVGQLIWLLQGDHGLAGLVAGLPERIAFSRAVLHVTFGITTAALAWAVLRRCGKKARVLTADARRAGTAIAGALSASSPADPRKTLLSKS